MSAPTLFSQAYSSYLALGVGGLGGRAAQQGCGAGLGEGQPWAACDTQPARLLATGLDRKLLLELEAGASAADLAPVLAARGEDLCRLSAARTVAVLMGALSEPDTAALLVCLALRLRTEGLFVVTLAVRPFPFEGPACAERAAAAQTELRRAADLCVVLDPAELLPAGAPRQGVSAPWRAAERALWGGCLALLNAFAGTPGMPVLAPEALRESLAGGGPIRGSVGWGEGPHAPSAAVAAALHPRSVTDPEWSSAEASDHIRAATVRERHAGPLAYTRGSDGNILSRRCTEEPPDECAQGTCSTRSPRALALAAGRELSLAEAEAIAGLLRAGSDTPCHVLLGTGIEPALGDEACALVLHRAPHGPKVVALK